MNSKTPEDSYQPPVSRLLSLGEPDYAKWDHYDAFDISSQDIPDLIRMATDEELNEAPKKSLLVWAPVHAWRALGELRAVEAVMPLLALFETIDECHDDWIQSDLPKVLANIGAAAFEPVVDFLMDEEKGEWARIAAADTLGKLGEAHPDLRLECIGKLAAQLTRFQEQTDTFNAFLVAPLWDLNAVEAMPVIKRAYAAGYVDESINGDLEDVEIHFGLKTEREFPPAPNPLAALIDGELEEEMEAAELEFAESLAGLNEPALLQGPPLLPPQPYIAPPKTGRNEPCPCGSGKKYKKCCGA